jgi:hypothetical protein
VQILWMFLISSAVVAIMCRLHTLSSPLFPSDACTVENTHLFGCLQFGSWSWQSLEAVLIFPSTRAFAKCVSAYSTFENHNFYLCYRCIAMNHNSMQCDLRLGAANIKTRIKAKSLKGRCDSEKVANWMIDCLELILRIITSIGSQILTTEFCITLHNQCTSYLKLQAYCNCVPKIGSSRKRDC